jgi:hypothetical protein
VVFSSCDVSKESRCTSAALADDTRRPGMTHPVAATAPSVGREAERLSLANLAARVAAAARRVLAGRGLDPRRDARMLESAERLLRGGAATLRRDESHTSTAAPQQDSYAFARITHSALSSRTARPESADEGQRREAAAKAFLELAQDVRLLLEREPNDPEAREAAQNLNDVFGQISSSVLRELGTPGDSLGGESLGLKQW